MVENDKIDKSYPVFGSRRDMISLSYLAFDIIRDKIANVINYPDSPFYSIRTGGIVLSHC